MSHDTWEDNEGAITLWAWKEGWGWAVVPKVLNCNRDILYLREMGKGS